LYPVITFKEIDSWTTILITDWGNKSYECEVYNVSSGWYSIACLMRAVTDLLQDKRRSTGVEFSIESEGYLYWLFTPLFTVNKYERGVDLLKLSIYRSPYWDAIEDDIYNELELPVPEIEFTIADPTNFASGLIAELEKHGMQAFETYFYTKDWQTNLDALKLAYAKARDSNQRS
jgi:hypothetical protein